MSDPLGVGHPVAMDQPGSLALHVILPGEDEAGFRARLDAWRADFPPRNPLEESLLEQAARLS
jgi:hypothetical protein